MAENIVKKIPKGTHHYEKFISPEELCNIFKKYNFQVKSLKGMNWNPISNTWRLTNNTSINYILALTKS